jgi:hypothetical protein
LTGHFYTRQNCKRSLEKILSISTTNLQTIRKQKTTTTTPPPPPPTTTTTTITTTTTPITTTTTTTTPTPTTTTTTSTVACEAGNCTAFYIRYNYREDGSFRKL